MPHLPFISRPAPVIACLLASALATAVPAKADGDHGPIGAAVKDLPLFDAHIHYKKPAWAAYPVKSIIELMDRNGVAMGLVSSTPDEGTIMLWEYAPDRIVPELFGSVEGDATLKPGLLLLADGGTLFLDEVAQMPDTLQTALLRVLDDQRVRPVGSEREIPLDLRLLFATNANLETAVATGQFRADLFHRMNVVNLHMPRLSDRCEDIVELAAHFMQQFSKELGMAPLDLDAETLLKCAAMIGRGTFANCVI